MARLIMHQNKNLGLIEKMSSFVSRLKWLKYYRQSLSLPHREKKDYQKGKEGSMGLRPEILFRKFSEIFTSQGAPPVVVTGGKFEIYHCKNHNPHSQQ